MSTNLQTNLNNCVTYFWIISHQLRNISLTAFAPDGNLKVLGAPWSFPILSLTPQLLSPFAGSVRLYGQHSHAGEPRHLAALPRHHQARHGQAAAGGGPALSQEPVAAWRPHRGVLCALPRQDPTTVQGDHQTAPAPVVGGRRPSFVNSLHLSTHTQTHKHTETQRHSSRCEHVTCWPLCYFPLLPSASIKLSMWSVRTLAAERRNEDPVIRSDQF